MLHRVSFVEKLVKLQSRLTTAVVVFFSISGETKKMSDDRPSIGRVLGRHKSNT